MAKEIPGFVDIHCHILPGVDDGAEDMEQAVALLRQAWNDGTRAVVLTPHYRNRYRQNVAQNLMPRFEALAREVRQILPDMKLYPGTEVSYELDIGEKVADGTILSLNNSRYVLLEFRHDCFRSRMLEGVLEMVNFGFTPIIAHAERYAVFLNNRALADEVLDLGALLQINADSIMGKHGLKTTWFCYRMLMSRKVQFVATDAHDPEQRPPMLKKCYERVRRQCGAAYANAVFSGNARTVLEGRHIGY